jgi:acetyltransferase-like isoleucine patch superfamily enzyme
MTKAFKEHQVSRKPFLVSAILSSAVSSSMNDLTNSFYVHPQGICETTDVGNGTRIWAFSHILKGARIGSSCNICDGVFIEGDVEIGDCVTVKSGVQLWDGARLGNRVFVGPNASFTNDKFPRSKQHPATYLQTIIEDDASIGANATVLPGVKIGIGAMIGAGAVVTKDVPARAIVAGNPGRVVGYAGASEIDDHDRSFPADFGAVVIQLGSTSERRGRLFVADDGTVPFVSKRFFLVDKVPLGEARGNHAHHVSRQFLVAAAGQITIAIDDGRRAFAIKLSRPDLGLYLPPRTWSMQYGHSPDAVLLVLTSDVYNRAGYISDYREFCKLTLAASGE